MNEIKVFGKIHLTKIKGYEYFIIYIPTEENLESNLRKLKELVKKKVELSIKPVEKNQE